MPASAWIINLVVLGVVLEADLGRRKITWYRLARPVIVAGAIVIYYLTRTPMATRSGGLAFELALAVLGIVLGLAAGMIFRIFREGGLRVEPGRDRVCGAVDPGHRRPARVRVRH